MTPETGLYLANIVMIVALVIGLASACLFVYVMYLLIRYLKQNLKK